MKITVLAGGGSSERDVSIKSGYCVAKSLSKRYDVCFLDSYFGSDNKKFVVTKDLEKTKEEMLNNTKNISSNSKQGELGKNVLNICKDSSIVFLSLHGKGGEDGKIQAIFDMMKIKYTGCGYESSVLGMNKFYTKLLLEHENILTSKYVKVTKDEKIVNDNKYPKVVKAVRQGSSIGVYIVNNYLELKEKVKEALLFDDTVLIEEFIKGREFSVGIIDDIVLPIVEIKVENFYDYESKYVKVPIEECPALIDDYLKKRLEDITRKAVKALNINSYARVDYIVNSNNDIYCLEVNTLPGMTDTSLLPKEAKSLGISYDTLCEILLLSGFRKYE